MKKLAGQEAIKQKKFPIGTYLTATGIAVFAVASMWFKCNSEPIRVIDQAKAPCNCDQKPGVVIKRVAGPRVGPFGWFKGRDSLHIMPLCEEDTTKRPDTTPHPVSTPTKTRAPAVSRAVIPATQAPCDCPDELLQNPLANGVMQHIVHVAPSPTLRDLGLSGVRVSFLVDPEGFVASIPQFKPLYDGDYDKKQKLDLASMIHANDILNRKTETPGGTMPCLAQFTIKLR